MITIGDKVYSSLGSEKTVVDKIGNNYILKSSSYLLKSIFSREGIFVNQYILYLKETLYRKITRNTFGISIIDKITYFDAKKSMYDKIDFREIKGCDKII